MNTKSIKIRKFTAKVQEKTNNKAKAYTKKGSSVYVKRNFGDVIKQLSKE